jgi:hypothetical protein
MVAATAKKAPARKAPARKAKPEAAQTVSEEPQEITLLGGVSPEQILGLVTPGQPAPTNGSSEVRPPQEFTVTEKVEPEADDGLYPAGTELFTYTPKSTGIPIRFPMHIEQPDFLWLWEQYERPFHVQSWEWMKLADIPKPMQRKAAVLGRDFPDEYLDLFDQWFKAMGGGARPGE